MPVVFDGWVSKPWPNVRRGEKRVRDAIESCSWRAEGLRRTTAAELVVLHGRSPESFSG